MSTEFLSATPAFAVSNIDRSVAFFTAVLSFEAAVENDGFALLRRDRIALTLWLADGSAPGAERELAGTVSCRIEVTGIDSWYEQCRAAGCVHPNGHLSDTEWGTREFAVLDPDNNLISFWQRLAT